ncbi:UNVERIFIED_CONTAM: hypothetical protein FKN15_052953 [Acipenser sinensis]
MGKKSRQRQRQKQQQQQLPSSPQTLWEDPASLFPWCSLCGKEDHRWRSCPDGPPADWCGRCEADGHGWAGCPHSPDQEQLQTSSSAATPPLPTSPPSPPSQEIWDWLMHPEADLFHDLPIVINTLWRRDGGRSPKLSSMAGAPDLQSTRMLAGNMDPPAGAAMVASLVAKGGNGSPSPSGSRGGDNGHSGNSSSSSSGGNGSSHSGISGGGCGHSSGL